MRVVLAHGHQEGEELLRASLPTIELVLPGIEPGALRAALRGAHAIVANRLEPEDTADALDLRLIQAPGAGTDGIDPGAVPPGCRVCTNHAHAFVIAEWALVAMLAASRDLLRADRALRDWNWLRNDTGRDLAGSTLGIVGLGPIGVYLARIAGSLGMRVLAVTRTPSPSRAEGLAWLGGLHDLERLMADSDFVVVVLPLTPETEGLIGESALSALGPGGYLINAARGPVVQERALYEALRDRRLAGAAVDVWYRYPTAGELTVRPAELPFWELDNIIMTPHVAGMSAGGVKARWTFIAEQLGRLDAGEPLESEAMISTK